MGDPSVELATNASIVSSTLTGTWIVFGVTAFTRWALKRTHAWWPVFGILGCGPLVLTFFPLFLFGLTSVGPIRLASDIMQMFSHPAGFTVGETAFFLSALASLVAALLVRGTIPSWRAIVAATGAFAMFHVVLLITQLE